jgi:hypothetical protein
MGAAPPGPSRFEAELSTVAKGRFFKGDVMQAAHEMRLSLDRETWLAIRQMSLLLGKTNSEVVAMLVRERAAFRETVKS